jgi:hypothetical protein
MAGVDSYKLHNKRMLETKIYSPHQSSLVYKSIYKLESNKKLFGSLGNATKFISKFSSVSSKALGTSMLN